MRMLRSCSWTLCLSLLGLIAPFSPSSSAFTPVPIPSARSAAPEPKGAQLESINSSFFKRGILAAAFYYWYRFAPGPDGGVDPAASERFYAYDPGSGLYIYKMGEDFPDYVGGDPNRPYKSMVDYTNPEWYRIEFRDMAQAGIDIAVMNAGLLMPLCRYAEGPNPWYAYAGVPVAAQTVREMSARGEKHPKLALLWDGSMAGYDLTTGFTESDYWEDCTTGRYTSNAWAAWLQVREFYRRMGATNEERAQVWGTVDGAPLIVVYERFKARFGQEFWDWLHDQFEKEFGVRPFIVLAASWSVGSNGEAIQADAFYRWDSTLHGPSDESAHLGGERFINVGPGFDTSWSPYRAGVPFRPREDGRRGPLNETGTFYDYSWQKALAMVPRIVMIETWNERYESTCVARTPRYDDFYIKKTRIYADALHRGVPVEETAVPLYPRAYRYRVPNDPVFAGRKILRYTAANDSMTVGDPRLYRQVSVTSETDGGLEINRNDQFEGNVAYSYPYLLTEQGRLWSYIHVHVADTWGFDLPDNQTMKVRMTYVDDRSLLPDDPPGSYADLFINYDSWGSEGGSFETSHPGDQGGNAYRMPDHTDSDLRNTIRDENGDVTETRWATIPLTGDSGNPRFRTVEWVLPRARFGNRQNSGADFRIAVRIPPRTSYQPLKIVSIEMESPDTMGPEYYTRTVVDATRGLRIAAGLQEMDGADLWRLDEVPGRASQDIIDMSDAVRLVRQMAGVDSLGVSPVPR